MCVGIWWSFRRSSIRRETGGGTCLLRAQAEFIAIFDADFLPEPDFLKRTIPYFQDKRVGFVQGRWTYLNADESLFCRFAKSDPRARDAIGRFVRGCVGELAALVGCISAALRLRPGCISAASRPQVSGDLPQCAHQVRAVRALLNGQLLQLQRHGWRVAQAMHQ